MGISDSGAGGPGAAADDLPHVAVLLLNWNAWGITVECLESLFRLEYPRLTVVLCDNASTDGSVDRFREWANGTFVPELVVQPRLRHLSHPPAPKPIEMTEYTRAEAESLTVGPVAVPLVLIHNGGNIGYAGGNNVGMRYVAARGDIPLLLVLNNDIVVAPDSLRELVKCASETPNVGAVGATMFEYNAPDEVQALGGGAFSRRQLFPALVSSARRTGDRSAATHIDFISGACLLAPTAAVIRAGMFDEAFYIYGEDIDLSLGLERLGLRLAYAPAAHIWHRGGGEKGYGNPKHDYLTVRNSLFLVRKYFPYMMPTAIVYLVYRMMLPKIMRRQWDRLAAVFRGWRDFRHGVVGKGSV